MEVELFFQGERFFWAVVSIERSVFLMPIGNLMRPRRDLLNNDHGLHSILHYHNHYVDERRYMQTQCTQP